MIKKFTINLVGKLCFLAMFGFLGTATVKAADVDLGALTINTVYDCPSFSYVRASFTPEATGTYRFNYTGSDRFAIYIDASLMTAAQGGGDWVYKSEEVEGITIQGYETWELTGGTTYYLGGWEGQGAFIMNSNAKFVITETAADIALDSTVPTAESKISIGSTEKMDFVFNMGVTVESATITTGTVSETFPYSTDADSKVRAYANCVSVLFKELLLSWLNDGTLKADDEFTVTLNGVTSSDGSVTYGEDGKVSVKFISAGMPGKLISITNDPETMPNLKSYYMKNDENGVITLTFDQELLVSDTEYAYAVWGTGNKESEDGDYYEETIPCIVEGMDVKVDLRGVLRNVEAMGLSMNYDYVQLDIKNVRTADGFHVYSEGSGKFGSFNYMYGYEEVNSSIASEFTPSKGEITAGDEMEIWVSGFNQISYTGVNFAYTQNGEAKNTVVGHENITVEADAVDANASILKFAVPTFKADENTTVVVSLAGLEVVDGLDHSSDIKAEYTYLNPTIEVAMKATPADGSIVDQLVNIELVWEGAETVSVDMTLMVGGAKLYKKNAGGEREFFSDMICGPTGTGNTAVLDILTLPTEDGEYVVEIAQGMFTVDGEEWKTETLNYTIGGGIDITLEDVGETPLAQFTLTATPCTKLEVNSEYVDSVTLAYLVEAIIEKGTYDVEITSGNTATLTFKPYYEDALQDGEYVVWIPEGYFLIDGTPNKDTKIYYDGVEFSGIIGISLDMNNLNIYNVNGMLVKKNGSAADLNNLDAGIYIINGKKVLIGK